MFENRKGDNVSLASMLKKISEIGRVLEVANRLPRVVYTAGVITLRNVQKNPESPRIHKFCQRRSQK